MKFLQRIAYFNVGMYPFTSIFLLAYCVLPALSLFSGKFIVQSLNVTFLILLLAIRVTLSMLALLEIRWLKITLHSWWRNEQFWLNRWDKCASIYSDPKSAEVGVFRTIYSLFPEWSKLLVVSGKEKEDINDCLFVVDVDLHCGVTDVSVYSSTRQEQGQSFLTRFQFP
ncbi:putative cellulose synthase-like family protein [Tanacetum coccineum]